jgi:hypothetical protein
VRRQQCARSTPTQSVPQHDILGSCMADAVYADVRVMPTEQGLTDVCPAQQRCRS